MWSSGICLHFLVAFRAHMNETLSSSSSSLMNETLLPVWPEGGLSFTV